VLVSFASVEAPCDRERQPGVPARGKVCRIELAKSPQGRKAPSRFRPGAAVSIELSAKDSIHLTEIIGLFAARFGREITGTFPHFLLI
jgi:hypothetical protein